ncbi:methyltransferase domain-containing protein [Georgenia sp. Z1344]|uniref:methyltransferase domain-containing protein n=1 Tax=Georgenia sp. Z1344 TaxID=3416706 RepID=UPI003CF1956E
MAHTWDPELYDVHADERARPFVDLLARVRTDGPDAEVRSVVDLGCGPGELTHGLTRRFPSAQVVGVDSSPAMLATAARHSGPRLRFEQADLRDWLTSADPVDVLVSNATLHWVSEHLELLPELIAAVRPGGCLAFQVPANNTTPMHAIRRELAARPPYAEHAAAAAGPVNHEPEEYLRALTELGCAVDAWSTTYLHVLTGEDPVLTWASGTAARPTLQALPEPLRERFVDEYRARLREAYPATDLGVVMPFRRVFVGARRSAAA